MKVAWTKHLKSEEERKKFEAFVKGSSTVLDRLATLLREKAAENQVFKKEDYNSPSWAYQAADRNGYNRALNEVLLLLNLTEEKN